MADPRDVETLHRLRTVLSHVENSREFDSADTTYLMSFLRRRIGELEAAQFPASEPEEPITEEINP